MTPPFDADHLRATLAAAPPGSALWVAFSGGLDSTVLLHAAAALASRRGDPTLQAVHVDHGLHPAAGDWAAHCRRVCAGLGVPLTVLALDLRPPCPAGLEAAARDARYRALAGLLGPGDCLATAHHQDDQAETLLLALLRGAGPHGLAAMPARARLGAGWLLRPLLGVGRAALADYAARHRLTWIDDPSNADTDRDRNLLRHQILPPLRARWPAVAATLTRSAAHCAEAAALLDDLADGLLGMGPGVAAGPKAEADPAATTGAEAERATDPPAGPIGIDAVRRGAGADQPVRSPASDPATDRLGVDLTGTRPGTLSVRALRRLDPPRARLVLRRWLAHTGCRAPSHRHLERILTEVLPARPDAQPLIRWGGADAHGETAWSVRRYRDDLHLVGALPPPPPPGPFAWDAAAPFTLPDGLGTLHWLGGPPPPPTTLAAGFARPGTPRSAARTGRSGHALQRRFQAAAVPPWLRPYVPLVFDGPRLLKLEPVDPRGGHRAPVRWTPGAAADIPWAALGLRGLQATRADAAWAAEGRRH